MEGLVPGRVVLYTDSDGKVHPSIVTAVHNVETGVINCTSIVDGWAEVAPRKTVEYDQTGVLTHTWAWMYQGQATRGNAK